MVTIIIPSSEVIFTAAAEPPEDDQQWRDDEQGREERRADLLRGIRDDLPVRFRAAVTFQMFVRVLHHHDRRIDHRPDGDRNAPERHDVGVEALDGVPIRFDRRTGVLTCELFRTSVDLLAVCLPCAREIPSRA